MTSNSRLVSFRFALQENLRIADEDVDVVNVSWICEERLKADHLDESLAKARVEAGLFHARGEKRSEGHVQTRSL